MPSHKIIELVLLNAPRQQLIPIELGLMLRFTIFGLLGTLVGPVVVYKPFSRQIIENFNITNNTEAIHKGENAAKTICKEYPE